MIMQDPFRDGHAPIATTKQITYTSLKKVKKDHMLLTQCRKMIMLKQCFIVLIAITKQMTVSNSLEKSHTQDKPLVESKNEDEISDAIEVWKIYKLLQRMKNK